MAYQTLQQNSDVIWYIRTNLVITFLVKSRNCRYQEGKSEGVGYSRGRKIKVKEGIKRVTVSSICYWNILFSVVKLQKRNGA